MSGGRHSQFPVADDLVASAVRTHSLWISYCPCFNRLLTIAGRGSIVRAVLVWILVLHTLHLPLPCPDLDGECRGTPITSLTESHAWHVLILGVRPNDDIDRGPFRTGDKNDDSAPAESPFGDSGVNFEVASTVAQTLIEFAQSRFSSHTLSPLIDLARALHDRQPPWEYERPLSARTFCARSNVWLI